MAQEIRTGIRLTGDASGMKAAFVAGKNAVADLNKEVGQTGVQTQRLDGALEGVGRTARGLAVVAIAMQMAQSFGRAADEMTILQSRLKLVTSSASELAYVQERLFAIAQAGRVNFSELGATYAQITRAADELGISQDRMLGITETISQAMTIGGGSAQAMNAALVQLSQGLASGTLRGEELNSVMEQTPRLAQAIADGLGVPRGQLRALAEDGKLTSEAVILALERAAASVRNEFVQAATTIGGALTVAKNSSSFFVAEMDRATGSSSALADASCALTTWGAS